MATAGIARDALASTIAPFSRRLRVGDSPTGTSVFISAAPPLGSIRAVTPPAAAA